MLNYKLEILHTIEDPYDDNIDFVLTYEGQCYSGSFFTLKNIDTLMRRWEQSGECACGHYCWAVEMIIVRELREDILKEVIGDLLESGDYKTILNPCLGNEDN